MQIFLIEKMNFKEHQIQFKKRWNIKLNPTFEVSFEKFHTRCMNNLSEEVCNILHKDEVINMYLDYYAISSSGIQYSDIIINKLYAVHDSPIEFYLLIERIALIIKELNLNSASLIQSLKQTIQYALNLSDVDITLGEKEDEIIFYPKGEKELDNNLVNKALEFLNQESNFHFIKSLNLYQEKNMWILQTVYVVLWKNF